MSNLTPGTWKLIPGSRSAHCCFDWSIVVDDPERPGEDSNSIAEVLCGTEADAHVLVAAKDLLTALEECVRVYEERRDAQLTGHLWPDPSHIFHARSVIAKAKGE